VTTGGECRSDYAGLSNDKLGEKPSRRKSKVSWGRLIRPGLVGPKPRPAGVGEGQQVNIPVLPGDDKDAMGGRRRVGHARVGLRALSR
jgi:hypothetical protein